MKPLFRKNRVSWFANGGILAAITAVIIAILSGLGTRLGWWHFGLGFTLLRWSVYVAIAAAAISALGIIAARPATDKRGLFRAIVGLVIAVPVIVIPSLWKQLAQTVPPIHDITTDTETPPAYVAVVPLRKDAPNSLEYGGTIIAGQQKEAYPDIKTLVLNITPAEVFDAALATIRDLNWEIIAEDKDNGHIEATDTTFWFGFKDDVVIRISPFDGGCKLDIRSVSRVGKSDVGTNAERIRSFLTQLKTRLG